MHILDLIQKRIDNARRGTNALPVVVALSASELIQLVAAHNFFRAESERLDAATQNSLPIYPRGITILAVKQSALVPADAVPASEPRMMPPHTKEGD